MPHAYDTSFKELVAHHFTALVPWLVPALRGAQVTRLSEDLPATVRRADLIVRCDREGAAPVLYLVECQCQADSNLPRDLLLRAALAHHQHRLLVETLLLAFTPAASIAPDYIFGARGDLASRHTISVRRLYTESAELALAAEIDAILPWIPTMNPADGDRARLLQTVLERILERIEPDAQRNWMLDQAATFATLRLPRPHVQGIVGQVIERRRYMLDPIRDFPWLRETYEEARELGKAEGIAEGKAEGKAEGIAEGKAEGKAEGIAEGKAEGMALAILTVLSGRGIAVDDILRQRILRCREPNRLGRWLVRAATVSHAGLVIADL